MGAEMGGAGVNPEVMAAQFNSNFEQSFDMQAINTALQEVGKMDAGTAQVFTQAITATMLGKDLSHPVLSQPKDQDTSSWGAFNEMIRKIAQMATEEVATKEAAIGNYDNAQHMAPTASAGSEMTHATEVTGTIQSNPEATRAAVQGLDPNALTAAIRGAVDQVQGEELQKVISMVSQAV